MITMMQHHPLLLRKLVILVLSLVVLVFGTPLLILTPASAMGNAPSTCTNLYDSQLTSITVTSPDGTFNPLTQPGTVISLSPSQTYEVDFIAQTAAQSLNNNTSPGTIWYSTTAPGYSLGVCYPSPTQTTIGPDENVGVNVTNLGIAPTIVSTVNASGYVLQQVTWSVWGDSQMPSYTINWTYPASSTTQTKTATSVNTTTTTVTSVSVSTSTTTATSTATSTSTSTSTSMLVLPPVTVTSTSTATTTQTSTLTTPGPTVTSTVTSTSTAQGPPGQMTTVTAISVVTTTMTASYVTTINGTVTTVTATTTTTAPTTITTTMMTVSGSGAETAGGGSSSSLILPAALAGVAVGAVGTIGGLIGYQRRKAESELLNEEEGGA